MLGASMQEAEVFSQRVNEVARLVEGLSKGSLSPEYIDAKLLREGDKLGSNSDGRNVKPPCAQAERCENKELTEAKKEELMAKVEEMKINIERKKAARARYEAHVRSNIIQGSTDYHKWDLWCPEDDEDELISQCTPNNPQLKAMEQDISKRHQSMVRSRQVAERCRVKGNSAFAARQWSEAYRSYETGLEHERTNLKLQSNAAMAALKLGCYAQAITHCDKVIHICDYLLEKPNDPFVVKALQRRAAARTALHHYKSAAEDLQKAAILNPSDSMLSRQVTAAQISLQEQLKLKSLSAVNSSVNTKLYDNLQQMEASVRAIASAKFLHPAPDENTPQGIPSLPIKAYKKHRARLVGHAENLLASMRDSEDLRLYFRQCGGVGAAAEHIVSAASEGAMHTICCRLLTEACNNDNSLRLVSGCPPNSGQGPIPGGSVSSERLLHACCVSAASSLEACVLLNVLSVDAPACQRVASVLTQHHCGQLVSPLTTLLSAMPTMREVHRVVTLSVLAKCVLQQGFTDAVVNEQDCIPSLRELISAETNTAALVPAIGLLTNATASPAFQAAWLAQGPDAIGVVVTHISRLSSSRDPSSRTALLACVNCLFNLTLEQMSQDVLVARGWLEHVPGLLTAESHELVLRVVQTTARCAKAQQWYVSASRNGVLEAFLNLAFSASLNTGLLSLDCPGANQTVTLACRWEKHDTLLLLDAVTRILAIWGGTEGAEICRTDKAVQLALLACRCDDVKHGCAGNAALFVSYLACDRAMFDRLYAAGTVGALVSCAYTRKGTSASRNAAIAVAKLAHDPRCLEQLRDMNGIEMLHAYVKP